MGTTSAVPRTPGQLVWCPADPSLGVGVVTRVEAQAVWVQFFRLQEERAYTTRRGDCAITRYVIAAGERVRDRQGVERRVRARQLDDAGQVLYELDDGARMTEAELVPEIRDIGARERLATLNLVHPEVVRARLLGLELAAVGRRPGHAAILGARVEWLPHQIDVAVRANAMDPVRLLLADEVGLGKTVEAALVYAALRQEGRANRVLVLTPDSLCIQWLGELYRKVHELFVLLDDGRLTDAATDFPNLSVFEVYRRVVASLEYVVDQEELADAMAAAEWDLVIVDEAHHLRWRPEGGGNPAYQLVERLAARTRHLLLLTATPMALDPAEYHALLRLLDPTRFDDPTAFERVSHRIALIREAARCIQQALHEGRPLGRSVTQAAAEVLEDDRQDVKALRTLTRAAADAPERGALAETVMAALRHRHGLASYVIRNRRGPVGGLPQRFPEIFPLEPTAAQAMLLEVGEGVMLDLAESLPEGRLRNQTLGQMLRALWATPLALNEVLAPISQELVAVMAPHIDRVVKAPLDLQDLPTGDARLRWLVEKVRALPEGDKLLVFVESPVAVRALRDALDPLVGGGIAVFHRGLAPRDQDRQVAYFRDPAGPRIMLSTEAGGEGRNFQFCHRVVLYDLPWRPATIEQRIGRVDRVGQKHDVHVWVPYFRGGYEAAILKVMQESIAVLDRTVGGIDPMLEYVSDQLSALILGRADAEGWKELYRHTERIVGEARERIEAGVDPILDFASFSPARVDGLMAHLPTDLEVRTEQFVQRYADHSHIGLTSKGHKLRDVEGAPSAAGGVSGERGFVATFSRTKALDHEEVEFLSFGHPLVEQALEWAAHEAEASAALAICRNFDRDGAAFLWHFGLDLPDDVPEAATYFGHQGFAFALDEEGKEHPELAGLILRGDRQLDRMDPAPLRSAGGRWRDLVEKSYAVAEQRANETVSRARAAAVTRLEQRLEDRHRDLKRAQARELALLPSKGPRRKAAVDRHVEELVALRRESKRLTLAIDNAVPRLIAVVAVRLLRTREASA